MRDQIAQEELAHLSGEDLELNLLAHRQPSSSTIGTTDPAACGSSLSGTQKTTHIHDDDLEMYVRGTLEPGHMRTVESHLLECEACRELFSRCVGLQIHLHYTGETDPDQKHERSEPRFVTGDDATLQELNPLSLDRQKVRILDVSRHGIGILTRKSIFPGTIVRIRIRNTIQVGEVRYCLKAGDEGYRIGLLLPKDF